MDLLFGIPTINTQTAVPIRERKSKWDKSKNKTVMPNVPMILPPDLKEDVLHSILLRIQLEIIEYQMNNLDDEKENINYGESPLKAIDNKLQLPADVRARDTLVSERQRIIESIETINPAFRPPPSILLSRQKSIKSLQLTSPDHYKQILGARAAQLKQLEKEFNVKITLRPKPRQPDDDDDSNDYGYVLVIGNNDEDVNGCINKIETIVNTTEEAIPDEEIIVNIDEYSLSIDPTKESHPWEDLYTQKDIVRSKIEVISDIFSEINRSGEEREVESLQRQELLRPFQLDLSIQDISCALQEEQPPGA